MNDSNISPKELKELNTLRIEKQAALCDKIKTTICSIGDSLMEVSEMIQELNDLQEKQIEYFDSIIKGEK